MAHKAHIKEAMFSTNRKDWEVQIMSAHARTNAIVHHRRRMLGKSSSEDLILAKTNIMIGITTDLLVCCVR